MTATLTAREPNQTVRLVVKYKIRSIQHIFNDRAGSDATSDFTTSESCKVFSARLTRTALTARPPGSRITHTHLTMRKFTRFGQDHCLETPPRRSPGRHDLEPTTDFQSTPLPRATYVEDEFLMFDMSGIKPAHQAACTPRAPRSSHGWGGATRPEPDAMQPQHLAMDGTEDWAHDPGHPTTTTRSAWGRGADASLVTAWSRSSPPHSPCRPRTRRRPGAPRLPEDTRVAHGPHPDVQDPARLCGSGGQIRWDPEVPKESAEHAAARYRLQRDLLSLRLTSCEEELRAVHASWRQAQRSVQDMHEEQRCLEERLAQRRAEVAGLDAELAAANARARVLEEQLALAKRGGGRRPGRRLSGAWGAPGADAPADGDLLSALRSLQLQLERAQPGPALADPGSCGGRERDRRWTGAHAGAMDSRSSCSTSSGSGASAAGDDADSHASSDGPGQGAWLPAAAARVDLGPAREEPGEGSTSPPSSDADSMESGQSPSPVAGPRPEASPEQTAATEGSSSPGLPATLGTLSAELGAWRAQASPDPARGAALFARRARLLKAAGQGAAALADLHCCGALRGGGAARDRAALYLRLGCVDEAARELRAWAPEADGAAAGAHARLQARAAYLATLEGPLVDLYALLGLQPRAGKAQVQAAFRALALALHPDKAAAPLPAEAAASLFAAIKEAHGTLADPVARRRYDLQYAWLVDVLRASV
uniref:J domain-containing protein n=1 Tax=Auxenochlorella protothecoides TaxID=3075 RepID=A0A1D1ZV49_AUXPR